ncbi:MAG: DNA-binding response regulator [Microcoleus sp. PH2017_10_PVI_O_A]|uniref:LuxR C-terminal-related transcriptional regulator n=1 Tax=unclassified Microcoleus TaxID=2642155 RepID=UPI001D5A8CAE|nr:MULTISPECIES: LuxR C-terminal-related transcriptional regulator [unclassified Microcoleus]TAE79172.1 MAG: DNA-binding response regulator [Oscillatoriales cyanobacterium]MCC3408468.1 DNA-binding response regulator [Microcoleus sp. PH2017_10_PVI_O_A]MCC3462575.1 DNA-binding response regulator [Microcoleus sp. PH2017_11_PCY_U_A]MCC3480996.1 DNA-binding response regulator [Microcoleus sp. PH2017_12_PCY_D_A]MCC3563678.1 DNA-binding response regulator [Microcoleus sp. PH2017_27_LUM_O_A]
MAEAKWQVSPRARKGLTEREKLFLRGLLCGYSPAEIADQVHQSRKGVEVYVSKTLYQYFKKIKAVPNETVGNWRNIPNWLEEEGYKTKSSVQSQSTNYLPNELLVKIGNICFDTNTGTIDINIRVSLPSFSECQRTENIDSDDRPSTPQSN